MAEANSKRKPKPRGKVANFARFNVEICILAGGQSKRMGRDKSRLRLGQTTMLGHIHKTARATGLAVRVIRRDMVPKCGPLGGIYTALKTTKADAVLFLACDMPLVAPQLMQFVLHQLDAPSRCVKQAIFVRSRAEGFPIILRRSSLDMVQQQIKKSDFSLQSLAKVLEATTLRLKARLYRQLLNVNTPREWTVVKRRLHQADLKLRDTR